MGGKSGLVKGKAAEREVIKILQPVVNETYRNLELAAPELKRNLMQFNEGGFDIRGLDWLALEVKRHECLAVNVWWKQTLRQAGDKKEPVLIYRQSRRPWTARIMAWIKTGDDLSVCLPVTLDLDSFLKYFSQRVLFHARKEVSCMNI